MSFFVGFVAVVVAAGVVTALVLVVRIGLPFAFALENWKIGIGTVLDRTGICVNPNDFRFAHNFA
jgi:hypothetical protein